MSGPRQTSRLPAASASAPLPNRSQRARAKIAAAAIDVLAEHGIAGITHRLVAEAADVPLAATTYYYESKLDIIRAASAEILSRYESAFQRVLGRAQDETAKSFAEIAQRLLENAANRDRSNGICWAEITLDSGRRAETHALAREWWERMGAIWLDIARACGVREAGAASRSAIDLLVGLLLMLLALGVTSKSVALVLSGKADPLVRWRPVGSVRAAAEPERRATPKAQQTRARILAAAIDALCEEGPGALTLREVASRANVTPTAPLYHFQNTSTLLAAAQAALFEQAKARYRSIVAPTKQARGFNNLVDVTTVVFLREATEHASQSMAHYSIWLEAARDSALRPMVWASIEDQCRAWTRVLADHCPQANALDALLAQALFIGKLVRIVSSGASAGDLSSVRAEFAGDLRAIVSGRHWAQSGTNDKKY